jgi:putative ABC transport system permease protein
MFLRLVADSFSRRVSRKLLTAGALALGMAVATAALSVSLDVGDRLASEFRSLGANLLVTPHADSLPLEIGGVDYRPANAGADLPEASLPKLKTIFWHNNIVGFAPLLDLPVEAWSAALKNPPPAGGAQRATLIGTWSRHSLPLPDGGTFFTGIEHANPWWNVEGHWFAEDMHECVVGIAFARRAALRIGDAVLLRAGSQTISLTISGLLTTGGPEDEAIVAPLFFAQQLAGRPGTFRRLYISAITKPEDAFGRRDPAGMTPAEFDRWFCTPYISSIALQIEQALPGTDARVIRRVAEGEGRILTRVRVLLWLVTAAALLAASLAVGATSAATIIERRTEIALMKALGAGSPMVKSLFAAEQILLAAVGGGAGYAIGILLARFLGQIVFGAAPAPSLLVLAVVLALAVFVTLAGSFFSMRRAARYEPAPILRGE